ncbi:MAG TPA: 30S ribosomal protein S8 [Candidatus Magasanikbacteria bacterium]|nr:30S ribosomal protein S8 [Candidatus Magasanikbacteria bacterium]
MMTDPIADMLTRIRNASMVRKHEVTVSYSKLKMAIAQTLAKEGYLEKVEKTKDKIPQLVISLKYEGREPMIHSLKRVSKPGQRRYVKSGEIGKVLNGFGIAILSTPQGIMTNWEASREKVGGEVICEVY